jgi:hypothetical protein
MKQQHGSSHIHGYNVDILEDNEKFRFCNFQKGLKIFQIYSSKMNDFLMESLCHHHHHTTHGILHSGQLKLLN